MFLRGNTGSQTASPVLTAALASCHRMGLHRNILRPGLSPAEQEQRKRVFWIAYILDQRWVLFFSFFSSGYWWFFLWKHQQQHTVGKRTCSESWRLWCGLPAGWKRWGVAFRRQLSLFGVFSPILFIVCYQRSNLRATLWCEFFRAETSRHLRSGPRVKCESGGMVEWMPVPESVQTKTGGSWFSLRPCFDWFAAGLLQLLNNDPSNAPPS